MNLSYNMSSSVQHICVIRLNAVNWLNAIQCEIIYIVLCIGFGRIDEVELLEDVE